MITADVTPEITLPDIHRFSPSSASAFYGAAAIASVYCGLGDLDRNVHGIWQHGWVAKHVQISPDSLFGLSVSDNKEEKYWVARADEEIYLRRQGFKHLKAIGLPIVYVEQEEVLRRQNSLLVMPAHSLEYTTHSWKFDEYADEIDRLRPGFSEIVVCVHPSCWEKGYWVDAFKKRGFRVVKGASVNDKNGLRRIHSLLATFEYVTTNGFGSHLAYASYMGAKVSFSGPFAEYRVEDFSNTPFYKENPNLIKPAIHAGSNRVLCQHFPHLFCHPKRGQNKC